VRKDQTETITLRLEKKILAKLHRESEQNQTSLNTLSNQIFRQHIDWHSKAAEAGYVPPQKPAIIKLLIVSQRKTLFRWQRKQIGI
jgi:hypothetical protein